MPSKPRSLAGILHRRRAADAEYNRARCSDPDRGVEDAVVSSARWKALRARMLRDEPVCRTGRPSAPRGDPEFEALRRENEGLKFRLEAAYVRTEIALVMPEVLRPLGKKGPAPRPGGKRAT
jgi:hypothetical protein